MSHPLDKKYEAEQAALDAKMDKFDDMAPELIDTISDLSESLADMVLDEYSMRDKDLKAWSKEFLVEKFRKIS